MFGNVDGGNRTVSLSSLPHLPDEIYGNREDMPAKQMGIFRELQTPSTRKPASLPKTTSQVSPANLDGQNTMLTTQTPIGA